MNNNHFLIFPVSVVIFGKTLELTTKVTFEYAFDEAVNQITFHTKELTSEGTYLDLTSNFEDLNLRTELASVIMDNEENWNNESTWWTETDSHVVSIDSVMPYTNSRS